MPKVAERLREAKTPPGTEGPDINATRLNRFMTIAAVSVLEKFKGFRQQSCVTLPFGLIVKACTGAKVTEAHTMCFVASNTNIPIPKIYCAFLRKRTGRVYIVQKRMKGERIGLHWEHRSEESKANVLASLKQMMDELRQLQAPAGTGVHDVCGGSMFDVKISWGGVPMGPFTSVDKFHLWMRKGWDPPAWMRDRPECNPMTPMDNLNRITKMHQSREFELKFTHGDLNWANILVNGDDVSAIIDWGTSGWYPDYWEYARMRIDTIGLHCTQEYVDQVLEPYEFERDADAYRTCYLEHYIDDDNPPDLS